MIKIDVFDKIGDLSHIDNFEQVFHCKDSIINMTDINKSSTFEQKMLYSEQTFAMSTLWWIFTAGSTVLTSYTSRLIQV